MQKRVEFGGKTYEFPDDATDAEIAAALDAVAPKPPEKSFGAKALDTIKALGSVAVDPLGLVNPSVKSTLANMSSGAAKNTGRTALDLTSLYTPSSGLSSQIPDLQSQNPAETAGSIAADVAMTALPGAAVGRGTRAAERFANVNQRWAMGTADKKIAETLLKGGKAPLTETNRAAVRASVNPASPVGEAIVEAMDKGVRRAKAGTAIYSPPTRPLLQSYAAQGLYNAGPAVNAATGGFASLLARLLSGGGQ